MEIAIQILMGVSLAACAGMRAFLPVLVTGLLARAHTIELNPHLAFMARDEALIIFGVATVVEFLADKFIAVDHALDAAATFLRPAAGTVLASSLLSRMDPAIALTLGLIVGGGTALTIHAGKTALRYKTSMLAPLHGGVGNAAVSFVEDGVVGVWMFITAVAPVLAFVLTIALLALSVWLVRHFVTMSRKGLALLRARRSGEPQ
jgi:hypothetical protein